MKVKLLAITNRAQELIEHAARTCYQSADKASEAGPGGFLSKLVAAGHESPFEHAYATFRISGCSRSMSHQPVRHRLMAVSQKSQRYVSERNFSYVVPPSVPPEFAEDFKADMRLIGGMYEKWKSRGLRNEDARYVLPNACTTEIIISANFREYRHIFNVRCSPKAQWEIREACLAMLKELYARAPAVFADLAEQFFKNRK